MELQAWNLGFLSILLPSPAVTANEVEVIFLGLFLGESKTGRMLPHIAPLAGDAWGAIVLSPVSKKSRQRG